MPNLDIPSLDIPNLDIKDAIATRAFGLRDGRKAHVYFWQPVYCPDIPEAGTYEYYDCAFQIVGIGTEKISHAGGVDSVQALMLAIKVAADNLYYSDAYESGELTYLGQRDLDLSLQEGMRQDRSGYEKADVLTHPGGNTIIQLPGDRFASVVFNGTRLQELVLGFSDIAERMDNGDATASKALKTATEHLKSILNYYEGVCRHENLHLPYVTPDP